jgi:hypothetical protein
MYDTRPKKQLNAGFAIGLVGGLIMILVSLAVFFMRGAETDWDAFVWMLQLAVYFFVGRAAASRQAEAQRQTYEPGRGVVGAGVGAPLTVSGMMWLFIIIRGIVRDAMGMTIQMEPVTFCGWIILDVLLAIGIGSWTGRSVFNQEQANPYDPNNF